MPARENFGISVIYSAIFLITFFFVSTSKILATSPSPSSSPTPSPTPIPIIKINSIDPTDNIVKGTSFKVNFSVENAVPLMDYYAKFGLKKSEKKQWKGKTFNKDKNDWFSFTGGNSSWDKFPKFTSDNIGKFLGTLEVMTSDSTEEGINNINIRVAKTDETSEHFDSVDSDPQQINIVSPTPVSTPAPTSTSSPTPTLSPTISPTASPTPSSTPKTTQKTQINKEDEEFEETSFSGEVLGASESSQAAKPEEQPEEKKESKKHLILPLAVTGSGLLFLLTGSFPFVRNFIKKKIKEKKQSRSGIL